MSAVEVTLDSQLGVIDARINAALDARIKTMEVRLENLDAFATEARQFLAKANELAEMLGNHPMVKASGGFGGFASGFGG